MFFEDWSPEIRFTVGAALFLSLLARMILERLERGRGNGDASGGGPAGDSNSDPAPGSA